MILHHSPHAPSRSTEQSIVQPMVLIALFAVPIVIPVYSNSGFASLLDRISG